MAHQAAMTMANGRTVPGSDTEIGRTPASGAADSGAHAVVSGVAGLGEDLLNLGELQARLVAVELRQNLSAVKIGGAAILAGSILAIVSLPIVLAGCAELLVSEVGLKRGHAFLGVGAVSIILAVACVAFAAGLLRRQRLGFPLTNEELTRNLNWVRTVLSLSGHRG
jgi:hypothetical protein